MQSMQQSLREERLARDWLLRSDYDPPPEIPIGRDGCLLREH